MIIGDSVYIMSEQLMVYDRNNPYYSLENFLIKINFIMIDVKDEDQLGEIIHEYTHYLPYINNSK